MGCSEILKVSCLVVSNMNPTCIVCGTPTKTKRQKYCSRGCDPDRSETCLCCGTFLIKRDQKKYCNRSCATKVNNVKYQKRTLEGSCSICKTPVSRQQSLCSSCKIKSKEKRCEVCQTLVSRTQTLCLSCKRDTRKKKQYFCLTCGTVVTPCAKYCGRVCSPFYEIECVTCSKLLHGNQRKYCSSTCYPKNIQRLNSSKPAYIKKTCFSAPQPQLGGMRVSLHKIGLWIIGELDLTSSKNLSHTIRHYLLYINDFCCQGCGFNTPHPADGKTILEVDHIDGDGTNHQFSNLRVLCPNCHALTTTYRGRNTGNGKRTYYYLRVQ